MQKPSQKIQSQILEYKLAKINRLITKIKQTYLEEGLDLRQLPQFLTESLKINQTILPNPIQHKQPSQNFLPGHKQKNSNKLTGQIMFALSETYQNLLSKLDDNCYFYPLRDFQPESQAVLKFQEIDLCRQDNKCSAASIKIEDGFKPQHQNSLNAGSQAIKKLKKELIHKRKQIKMLKAQYQTTKIKASDNKKPAKKQPKRPRKTVNN